MTQVDTQGDVYGNARNYESNGGSFHDASVIEDTQIQHDANGKPFNPDSYLDATGRQNIGVTDDYLNRNAGMYRTNKPNGIYHVAVARPIGSVSGVLLTAKGLLAGWNLTETAGSTAKVRLRSGLDLNQPILLTVTLAANESTRDFPPLPIEYKAGLYLELVSGSIEGAIYTREERRV